ncbi:aminopeptidase DmpA [Advenella kashmirensis WT001]|uniref:Aminopeptidase DmpA n=1 Tax=Advenella kashmirensis (strain DSM 17095 / LMG 22695 / WT001) TaxID=1036672 RepID=I3UA59_ADVKW|nr:P1 family peptidase [Advenella kashmirensis]AFK61897.1 aminopeptidase DmpA [Advenella kashmirensis WT001]
MPEGAGGYTVGVLVQTNFGGVLTMNGAPVGKELGRYYLKEVLEGKKVSAHAGNGALTLTKNDPIQLDHVSDRADGSIMMIVATDAPLGSRNLERLAKRAMLGLARTGSPATNGSGDYVIAFSTAPQSRINSSDAVREIKVLGNNAMSPLFLATVEATEEAIYNSLLKAKTTTGRDGRVVEALPIDKTVEILKKYGAVK